MAILVESGADNVLNRVQLDQLRQLEAFKPGVCEQLVTLFERRSAEKLNEMRSAAECRDFETMRRSAHSLKGFSASLGASALSTLAGIVEDKLFRQDVSVLGDIDALSDAILQSRSALAAWIREMQTTPP